MPSPAAKVVLIAVAMMSLSRPSWAQVVERNLPPSAARLPQALAPPSSLGDENDAKPIGPVLRAVVLLDAEEPLRVGVARGVFSSPRLQLSSAAAAKALRPFLDHPLSHRLIGQAQAAVARRYRAMGFPFLAVALPEQEVTRGVLQLRVIAFNIGQVRVEGARTPGEAQAIAARLRLAPGRPIDAPAVSDDLDWLNRDPFLKAAPTFSRGDGLGRTDVRVTVRETRPWSAYAGYADSGSPSTGTDRYFVGVQAGDLLGFGSLISYQGTASGDALFNGSHLFSSANQPRYVSHAGRLSLQPLPRLALEVSADGIETHQVVQDFLVAQKTFELAADLRVALSDFWRRLGGWGDVRLGVAGKRQQARTLFGGVGVAASAVEDYQIQFGWSRAEVDGLGASTVDLLLHLSPGGVDRANDADRVRVASQGRLQNARYAYLSGDLDRQTRLPKGWNWRLQAIGQYAAEPLPTTEQAGLGAQSLVRGYTLDDGAYDRALVIRNDLRAPAVTFRPGLLDALNAYAFVDVGRATRLSKRSSQTASSLGLGASLVLAGRLAVDMDVGRALQSADSTHAGDWKMETRLTVAY